MESCSFSYQMETAFYKVIKDKTVACNFFAIQFSRHHIGLYNRKYSMIDLEGVHPIKDLPDMMSLHAFFDHNDYRRFVTSRFLALYPSKYKNLSKYFLLENDSWKSKLKKFLSTLYPARILLYWRYRFQQWIKIKLFPTHTHLIEF